MGILDFIFGILVLAVVLFISVEIVFMYYDIKKSEIRTRNNNIGGKK